MEHLRETDGDPVPPIRPLRVPHRVLSRVDGFGERTDASAVLFESQE